MNPQTALDSDVRACVRAKVKEGRCQRGNCWHPQNGDGALQIARAIVTILETLFWSKIEDFVLLEF